MFDKVIAQRVLDDLVALHQGDDVIGKADPMAQLMWLVDHPYLAGVAKRGELAIHDVLLASMSHSYEWGAAFEITDEHAPTMDDWRGAYYDIANQFCGRLGMPPAFVGDNVNGWRLRGDLGGPF